MTLCGSIGEISNNAAWRMKTWHRNGVAYGKHQ